MLIIEQYGPYALIALIAALVIFLVLRPRGKGKTAPSLPAEPKAPLQPVKPDIVAAEPAQFAAAEPVAVAAPPPAPSLVSEAAPEPAPAIAPATAGADNLALLKGVGPKLISLLASLGVTRFDQIAAWTEADIAAIDAQLGAFAGRPQRDNWVDQAGYLARGDKAGFEAKYGALGGEL